MRTVPEQCMSAKVNLKPNNYFSGKYVVGKLLDRDNFSGEYDERPPNYDLKSLSLKGTLLTQNEVLMNILKYEEKNVPHRILLW